LLEGGEGVGVGNEGALQCIQTCSVDRRLNNRRVRTDFVKFKGDEVLLVFGVLIQDGVLLRPDDSDTIVKNLHRLTAGEGERWRSGTAAEGRGRRCGVRTAGGVWRNSFRRVGMSHDVRGGVVGRFGSAK
jgi:hypothetical protein